MSLGTKLAPVALEPHLIDQRRGAPGIGTVRYNPLPEFVRDFVAGAARRRVERAQAVHERWSAAGHVRRHSGHELCEGCRP